MAKRTQSRPPAFLCLPFVAHRRSDGFHYWQVKPSGDYLNDRKTGEDYALLYAEFIHRGGTPPDLIWIVGDMARTWNPEDPGIAQGFMEVVENLMRAGLYHRYGLTGALIKRRKEWGARIECYNADRKARRRAKKGGGK